MGRQNAAPFGKTDTPTFIRISICLVLRYILLILISYSWRDVRKQLKQLKHLKRCPNRDPPSLLASLHRNANSPARTFPDVE